MVVKQKPAKPLVHRAAEALRSGKASKKTIQEMAGRILDDQKNAPKKHKVAAKKKPN
jgi:hypothetical protein